jgi:hypothetical protein
MTLLSAEHYDLMAAFEREFRGQRLDREAKHLWPQGVVYQSGETNNLFLAYRRGYALAKAVYLTKEHQ